MRGVFPSKQPTSCEEQDHDYVPDAVNGADALGSCACRDSPKIDRSENSRDQATYDTCPDYVKSDLCPATDPCEVRDEIEDNGSRQQTQREYDQHLMNGMT